MDSFVVSHVLLLFVPRRHCLLGGGETEEKERKMEQIKAATSTSYSPTRYKVQKIRCPGTCFVFRADYAHIIQSTAGNKDITPRLQSRRYGMFGNIIIGRVGRAFIVKFRVQRMKNLDSCNFQYPCISLFRRYIIFLLCTLLLKSLRTN